uniref:Uncharacterized protein n=1 Tax=Myotis myotis TaxID=51298 RepID=A0A7J7XI24_MYOMY|nr:hypothetical protein mMyoMyo1_011734 [Myotis myotis]
MQNLEVEEEAARKPRGEMGEERGSEREGEGVNCHCPPHPHPTIALYCSNAFRRVVRLHTGVRTHPPQEATEMSVHMQRHSTCSWAQAILSSLSLSLRHTHIHTTTCPHTHTTATTKHTDPRPSLATDMPSCRLLAAPQPSCHTPSARK